MYHNVLVSWLYRRSLFESKITYHVLRALLWKIVRFKDSPETKSVSALWKFRVVEHDDLSQGLQFLCVNYGVNEDQDEYELMWELRVVRGVIYDFGYWGASEP